MPAAARTQLQGGNRRGWRVRRKTRLADGLRGHFRGVQADLGKARSQLPEQNSRPRKSDERNCRGLDLEKVETETAIACGSRRGGDLHGARGLSRGVNRVRAFIWIRGR